MRKIFTTMLIAAFFMSSAFKTTDAIKFNAADLRISWEVMDNNYQGKNEALTALVITNGGKEVLPAGGWKFYFNSGRGFTENAVSGNAKINQVNGDLYSITPTAGFKELKPGESARIEYVNDDPVVNVTDAPEGIYLVWDAQPEKGYSIGSFDIKPYKPTYVGLITPEIVYDRNKTVTDIPVDQLPKILPTPVSYKETGSAFTLTANIHVSSADKRFDKELAILNNDIKALFGKRATNKYADNVISLEYKEGLNAEGYELSVKPSAITIRASTAAGMFYGIQSFKTLIPVTALAKPTSSIQISCVEVADAPRFPHRAVMLDVARNFQPQKQVIKLLEAMRSRRYPSLLPLAQNVGIHWIVKTIYRHRMVPGRM
jgi:hexosaminidase